jgi:PAS domain S-box-containing protein
MSDLSQGQAPVFGGDTLGIKLAIAFGFLVSILIWVSWLGLSRMSRINADLNEILGRRWARVELAREGLFYANSNYQITTSLLLLNHRDKETIDALIARRAKNGAQISAIQKKLADQADSDQERELLATITDTRSPVNVSVKRLWELLVNEDRPQEARDDLISTTIPLLNKYHDSWNAFVQFEVGQMEQARNRARDNYADARKLMMFLVLPGIAMAIGIAVFVTRKLAQEATQREQAKEEIRQLNEGLEKKVAERTEELARLAGIVESSYDAMVSETPEGIILSWNIGAEKLFGYSPAEAIGRSASMVSPPNRTGETADILQRVREGKTVEQFETVRVRKDGSQVQVAITVSPIRNASGEIVACSAVARDITERKKAEERFQKAFHANPEPIIIATISGSRYIDVNESFLRIMGYQREEVVGRTSFDLEVWEQPEDRRKIIEMLKERGMIRGLEIILRTKSGRLRTMLHSSEIIEIAGEKCVLAILQDITEQKSLEKQLRQAQKMEAIGQLSGGIAHDFNNLLSVIIGYSEIIEESLPASDPRHNQCGQIRKAGQSASSLTRQLLAFSRQQVLEPKILDVNNIVLNVEKMLHRLIGEHIDLRTALDPALGRIKADQGQMEQVLFNLVVNARDAMPQGGKLTIETANVDLDEDYACRHVPQLPGPYVQLTISDTGIGMDATTQSHIFEPFFTTKEIGKGTGLGLSTVYGVVRQSNGHIWVYSEPGLGTTFKIYLPRTGVPARLEKPIADLMERFHGTGTILLVEDDESVRRLARTLLEDGGYFVLEAECPDKAIEIAQQHAGPIQLLLTDVIMPGMNGPALAGTLAPLRPDMRVLYMSGYTGFTHPNLLDSDVPILPKPFTRETLLRKLHDVLARDAEPQPS